MTVFLMILKIIGLILLGLLGLLLLLVLLVLFVPVRYSGRGLKEPGVLRAEVGVTWLLHLVRFKGTYEHKNFRMNLKVLFFTIMDSGGEEKDEEKEEDISFETEEDAGLFTEDSLQEIRFKADRDEGSEEGKEENGKSEAKEETLREERAEEDSKEPEKAESDTLKDAEASKEHTETKEHGENKGHRRPKKPEKHEKNSGNEEISLKDRIGNLINNRDYLERAWEKKKDVIKKALGRVKKLIIHVLPHKIQGYVEYGFEDPALTGEVLGVIAVLYSRTGHKLKICPDFENRVLNADVTLKGKIRIFTFLLLFVLVYFNKELRRTWKYVRHLSEVDMDEERASKAAKKQNAA